MRSRTSQTLQKPASAGFILPLVVVLLFSVFAVIHLLDKPGLPGEHGSSLTHARVVSLDGVTVRTADEVEFLLSGHPIGARVDVVTGSDSLTATGTQVLAQYYGGWFILFDVLTSAVILGLAIVVSLFHTDRRVAMVFLGASIALVGSLLGTKTLYAMQPAWLGTALCVCFFLSYSTLPVTFFHFVSIFPVRRGRGTGKLMPLFYAGAALMGVWQAVVYLGAARARSIELFRASVAASGWMNALMVAGIVGGLLLLVGSYRRAESLSERKKAAWVLYGLALGTLPFVLFWALPQAFQYPPVIPEPLFKVFLLAIPASFTIAILRYRMVDITILISRSAVHAIVIGTLLVLYALLIGVTLRFASGWTLANSLTLSAAAAVLSAVLYDAVRRGAQRLVDRSFFRLSYNFRGSLKEVLDELKKSRGMEEMADNLVEGVEKLLPVDRIGYFTLEQPGNRLRTLAERNFPLLTKHGVRFEIDRLKSGLDLPVAVDDHIEGTVPHESADAGVFGRWGISLAVPMKTKNGNILGFLVLGRKSSGLMFTEEDIDLLTVVAGEAAAENERLNLQQDLSAERAEAERLEELSRLKSYFVSSVSHDLKTPLTSIRMFAELLRTKSELPAGTADEYLKIIEGESERLTRLINNVLDFAKIEQGIKEYAFRESDLNDIVLKMMAVMQYQFTIAKCETSCDLAEGSLHFVSDPDAILEALLNLVSNSLKYSGDHKRIHLSTASTGEEVSVAVEDNGFGIDPAECESIFEPFRRVRNDRTASRGGAGLGLSVVKDIVKAHQGNIRVRSEPGGGSTFTLVFPTTIKVTNDGGHS
jgi:signal transduction histidine kinase